MTKFKLLAVATVLSAMIATPGIAQQAVQEPGLQAFYQSLGVGSRGAPASAAACARSHSFASEPLKHIAPRRHAVAHTLCQSHKWLGRSQTLRGSLRCR